MLVSVVAGLSSFMEQEQVDDASYREDTAYSLVAKMPVLAAIAFRTSVGLPIVGPQKNLGYIENFLYMMFQDPMDTKFKIPKICTRILEKMFILYADSD